MGMKVYAVKECGQIRGAMFSLQIGVYSTLEKAQKRMNSCFATAMESLKKNDEISILSWEQDPMETTIIYRYVGESKINDHFAIIDERIIDEDADEFLFAEPK